MRSKKRTIGILIVVIVVLLGFAGSLLVYRNKLSSEKIKDSLNQEIIFMLRKKRILLMIQSDTLNM